MGSRETALPPRDPFPAPHSPRSAGDVGPLPPRQPRGRPCAPSPPRGPRRQGPSTALGAPLGQRAERPRNVTRWLLQ